MFYLSSKSKQHRKGVDRRLIQVCDRAIQITKIDFGIPSTGGKRSDSVQYQLYINDASPYDGIHKKGKHQLGKALDFYAYVNGKVSYKKEHLAQIAAAFLQAAIELNIKIRWGGLFTSWFDGPHIELVD